MAAPLPYFVSPTHFVAAPVARFCIPTHFVAAPVARFCIPTHFVAAPVARFCIPTHFVAAPVARFCIPTHFVGDTLSGATPETETLTDRQTKNQTNEHTELHQFRKEPSYDGNLSPCQV